MALLKTDNVNQSTLLSAFEVKQKVKELSAMSVEEYADKILLPSDKSRNIPLEEVFSILLEKTESQFRNGPLLIMEGEIAGRKVALIGQDRNEANGVFKPEHHSKVSEFLKSMNDKGTAIVSFIDTPGADAGEVANSELQAHSISALIASFANLTVPSIGVVWGKGYSGGAIPFATSHRLFIVKDGLFNTIQPQGLAAIARRQNLSWQECAKLVGLSSYELAEDGVVDGVIGFSPCAMNEEHLDSLRFLLSKTLDDVKNEAETFALEEKVSLSSAYIALRQKSLRSRIRFNEGATDENAVTTKPSKIQENEVKELTVFEKWIGKENPINYEIDLKPFWDEYQNESTEEASSRLAFEISAYLYHSWMNEFEIGAAALKAFWETGKSTHNEQVTLQSIINIDELKPYFSHHIDKLCEMESLYRTIISKAPVIASEYSKSQEKRVSEETVLSILASALDKDKDAPELSAFCAWLNDIKEYDRLDALLNKTSLWKKKCHPQMEDIHLLSVGYFVSNVVLDLHGSLNLGKEFDGRFLPKKIGRIKNFWYRLTQTSRQVRIESVLSEHKSANAVSVEWLNENIFTSFSELNAGLETANPKRFPGFSQSIFSQHQKGSKAVGLVTGVATLGEKDARQCGFFISNSGFQAGAFDMASGEKFCRLLAYCEENKLPVTGMISSGGMQTKEGPAALFSMALVNNAINQYHMAMPNRIMIIGYGDCTGGAQASLVTHPQVRTAYLSATNMPFAGQVVVPEHLSLKSTLSNYLYKKEGAMDSLVSHPFLKEIDKTLNAIDPEYSLAQTDLITAMQGFLESAPDEEQGTALSKPETPSKHNKVFGKIDRILIHARGCTASRLIAASHKLNKQVVLVQSDPDMDSGLASQLNNDDILICLGGSTPDESYLNADSVLRIAELQEVDAIHPGIGFLSENADFAELCNQKKINFVGPDSSSIALMGDKAEAISTADSVGLPTVPGSNGVVESIPAALDVANRIGYPLLIKSSFGGGGKGIAIVNNDDELKENFSRLSLEAKSAFGNGELYIERYLDDVRHVEVQVLRDTHQNCRILGVRDCSVQRSRQKIVEESGEYVVSEAQRQSLYEWSEKLSHHINYVGAGTVEFLYDLTREEFYFMEMNTRLQVEHPVTEMTTGIDIVEQQFAIAEGHSIAELPKDIKSTGHAIELRINAETIGLNPNSPVIPSAGKVTSFSIPEREWARTLYFLQENKDVTPFYDSLIIQLIAYGKDRNDAIQKISELLSESKIEGVDTNIHLLARIMEDETFQGGEYSTGFLDAFLAQFADDDATEDEKDQARFYEVVGDEIYLKSPSAGVIYLSSAPGEAAFVSNGDVISGEQTLFLLEVMKVFMPIKLNTLLGKSEEQSYEVVHVRAEDGAYIQSDDVVMILKPSTTA